MDYGPAVLPVKDGGKVSGWFLKFLLTGCGAGYVLVVLGEAHVYMVDIKIFIFWRVVK
jgi:hypothetical protein